MGIRDANEIVSKVFACCLTDKKEAEKIQQAWKDRFSPLTAFLTVLEPKPNLDLQTYLSEIVEDFTKQANAAMVTSFQNPIILALFIDFTNPECVTRMPALWKLPLVLNTAVGCSTSSVMEFGYCGPLGGLKSKKSEKEAVRAAVELNRSTPHIFPTLLLVSPQKLAERNYWKEQIVLLDAMRREQSPLSFLPHPPGNDPTDDIGYISYGEYDAEAEMRLKNEGNRLLRMKNGESLTPFKALLDERLEAIRGKATSMKPNGAKQPQHPDMELPEDGFFSKPRKKAKKGENSEYNEAKRQTEGAANATKAYMCERIINAYSSAAERDAADLEKLLEGSGVGITACTRSNVMACLNVSRNSLPSENLDLKYKEEGASERIDAWFQVQQAIAIEEGKSQYYSAMRAAAEKLDDNLLASKFAAVTAKLNNLNNLKASLTSAEDVCDTAQTRGKAFNYCSFTASGVGESRGFLMLRGGTVDATVEQFTRYNQLDCLRINGKMGGVVNPDTAPLKGIRIFLYNFEGSVLDTLLPEVNLNV